MDLEHKPYLSASRLATKLATLSGRAKALLKIRQICGDDSSAEQQITELLVELSHALED